MQVKTEEITGYRVKLFVTLDNGEVEKAASRIFREGELSKKSKSKAELLSEAVNLAVNEGYERALKEHNLTPLSPPVLIIDQKTIGLNKNLKFTVEFDVYPKVKLGKYRRLAIRRINPAVSDEELNAQINEVLKAHASYSQVDRAAKEGDVVNIDFIGSVLGEKFDGGSASNYDLELGSNTFIPGFEARLVGAKPNEKVDVNVKFPENYHSQSLRGKDATFVVTVNAVKEKAVPLLSDSFVVGLKLSGVKTADEYKKKLKKDLEIRKKEYSDRKYAEDCVNAAVAYSKVEIPDALIFQRVDWQVEKMQEQAKRYGVSLDNLLARNGVSGGEKEYRNLLVRPCEDELIKEFVLAEVAKVEKLQVTQEDADRQHEAIAKETGKKIEEVKKEYSIKTLEPFVLNQKAAELIKNDSLSCPKAQITLVGEETEKKCDVLFTYHSEEFNKNYVVFTDAESLQSSAAALNPDHGGEAGYLSQIQTDEEWMLIQQLLDEYEAQTKEENDARS